MVLLLAGATIALRETARTWEFAGVGCALAFWSFILGGMAGGAFGWVVGLFVRKPDVRRAVIWTATVALGLGILAFFAEGAWRNHRGNPPDYPDGEETAVALVRRLDGTCERDFGRPMGFRSVVAVNLNGTRIKDEELKKLAALKSLASLSLHSKRVTDAGLKELAPFTKLTVLHLGDRVTDAGLKELVGLRELAELHQYGSKVTNEGVGQLQAALPRRKIYLHE